MLSYIVLRQALPVSGKFGMGPACMTSHRPTRAGFTQSYGPINNVTSAIIAFIFGAMKCILTLN